MTSASLNRGMTSHTSSVAGFPVSERPLPELAVYGTDPAPDFLDLEVTEQNCGRHLGFGVLRDGWTAARPVALDLPGCALAGTLLRLPVAAD